MISNTLKWTHWINPRFSKCFSHHKKGQHLTVHKIKVKPIGSIRDPSSVFSHHNKGRYLIVHMSNFAMGTILGKGLPNFSHDKIVFSNNVCFIKFRSKLSSVLLLCLLRIFMKQTLHISFHAMLNLEQFDHYFQSINNFENNLM